MDSLFILDYFTSGVPSGQARQALLALSNLKTDISENVPKQIDLSPFISDSPVIKLVACQLICASILYITAVLWLQSDVVVVAIVLLAVL